MRYVCPMHKEIVSGKPGKCSICGMSLVLEDKVKKESKFKTYQPLIIIISLISFVSLVSSGLDFKLFLMNFMSGFFLVFSGFKLLDLNGFAQGYSTYDLIARKFYHYGFIYPFIELFFGISYLLGYNYSWINFAVIIVMGISGLGVLESIMKKRKFQCACLGTIIKVPLSEITLIEDFGMVVMAILALVV
ncbi:MAG: heavy metal-binding domain-containing protein [Microgenomates group bacterium]